jgi:hypothetical protein
VACWIVNATQDFLVRIVKRATRAHPFAGAEMDALHPSIHIKVALIVFQSAGVP